MKISIEIDVSDIVRQEVQRQVAAQTATTSEKVTTATASTKVDTAEAGDDVVVTVEPAVINDEAETVDEGENNNPFPKVGKPVGSKANRDKPAVIDYEYGPKPGRRRGTLETALHDKELEVGRRLTPEEKGEIDALVELAAEREGEAKRRTKRDAEIADMIKESLADDTDEGETREPGTSDEEPESEEESGPENESGSWDLPEGTEPSEPENDPTSSESLFGSSTPSQEAVETPSEEAEGETPEADEEAAPEATEEAQEEDQDTEPADETPAEEEIPEAEKLDNLDSLFK